MDILITTVSIILFLYVFDCRKILIASFKEAIKKCKK